MVERRFRHVIETDPGGAWLAEEDGRPVGAALAILREGLWGLSLLVVHPDAQSGGIGRALLERTLRYGDGARGGIIASSGDSRALRAYARAGFAAAPRGPGQRRAAPARGAAGRPRGLARRPRAHRGGRPRGPRRRPRRRHRGAAGRLAHVRRRGARLRARPRDIVACWRRTDEDAARDLLRAVIATAPEGESIRVEYITAAQGWAVDVVLEAGLALEVHARCSCAGTSGRFHPYLPSGAYL